MPTNMIIRLAYGVMIVGMIMCFILSKRQKKDLRKTADDFALAFAALSNYICPTPPHGGLAVEELEGGAIRALPIEGQPEYIRSLISRATKQKSVKLFAQMVDVAEQLAKEAGKSRRLKEQFSEPIDRILMMTHTFLEGCENLATIDTAEKKEQFDSFLLEQVEHRMVLLRRISGTTAEEYRKLNRNYAKEMEAVEQEEREAKQRKAGGQTAKPQKPSDTQEDRKAGDEKSDLSGQKEAGQQDGEDQPPAKKNDWQGWGCG